MLKYRQLVKNCLTIPEVRITQVKYLQIYAELFCYEMHLGQQKIIYCTKTISYTYNVATHWNGDKNKWVERYQYY